MTKPESGLTYSRQQAPVTTVAHFVSATRQAVSDAGQLETYINQFLTAGVADALEQQMLNGTGTSPQLLGILATPGIQTQAAVSGDTAGIQAVREAVALIQQNAVCQPSAVLMSIADDAAVDLARDNQGRFFGAGPFGTGPNTLWGLPRIASWFLPTGTALVGDFKQAVLFDREQASISVSDSHSDYFVRNMLAVLGEARCAFAVLRPAAFCTVAV